MNKDEQRKGQLVGFIKEWSVIIATTPDYDCWPAPVRGWEVVMLVNAYKALLAENEALRARIDRAVGLGHNDDCMFCWLKDKVLGDAS